MDEPLPVRLSEIGEPSTAPSTRRDHRPSAVRGVQTWSVPPGGGMCFELLCDVRGEFPFVNDGFGHGQKGAIGILVVE